MTKFDELHLPDTVKDVGIAIGSVIVVFLLTFAYSGNWPPMVVIAVSYTHLTLPTKA